MLDEAQDEDEADIKIKKVRQCGEENEVGARCSQVT